MQCCIHRARGFEGCAYHRSHAYYKSIESRLWLQQLTSLPEVTNQRRENQLVGQMMEKDLAGISPGTMVHFVLVRPVWPGHLPSHELLAGSPWQLLHRHDLCHEN